MSDASQPLPPLDLRAGVFYRRRDGRLAGPLGINPGCAHDQGSSALYPWFVPIGPEISDAYSVDESGMRFSSDEPDDGDLIEAVVVTNTPRPGETPEQTAARDRTGRGGTGPACPAVAPVADALAAEASAHVAAMAAAPADAGPAAGDAALLAAILEEARRETVAMLGRAEPTTLAIARMVGPGYPLGDAVAAIREADQMAFAAATPQAADYLIEAIAALAVAVVTIREER